MDYDKVKQLFSTFSKLVQRTANHPFKMVDCMNQKYVKTAIGQKCHHYTTKTVDFTDYNITMKMHWSELQPPIPPVLLEGEPPDPPASYDR